jgi:phage host-nuclease inhibitor protein Gam
MIALSKTARIKKTTPALKSRLDMERCVGELARLQIERDGLCVEMDERIIAIRAEYEARLNDLGLDIASEMTMAREWAEANPAEFGDLKSIEFTHGTAGWRTGMPKLKTLAKWTWDRVLEKLAALRMQDYIRTKQEVDKEKLLADREALAEKLPLLGVQVVQDEAFFVQPKREEQAE